MKQYQGNVTETCSNSQVTLSSLYDLLSQMIDFPTGHIYLVGVNFLQQHGEYRKQNEAFEVFNTDNFYELENAAWAALSFDNY